MKLYSKVIFLLLTALIAAVDCTNANRKLIEFHHTIFDYSEEEFPPASPRNESMDFLHETFQLCDDVIDVVFPPQQDLEELVYWVVSGNTEVTRQELQECYLSVVEGNEKAKANLPVSGLCSTRYLNGYNIPCTQNQALSFAIELCPNGAPQASARCSIVTVNTEFGPLEKIDFDLSTMKKTICNYTIPNILQTLSGDLSQLTEEEIGDEIAQLNLQSSGKNFPVTAAKDAIQSLSFISEHLANANKNVTVDAFSHFLDTASKVNLVYEAPEAVPEITVEDKQKLVNLLAKTTKQIKINESAEKSARFVTETINLQVNIVSEEDKEKPLAFSPFGLSNPAETLDDTESVKVRIKPAAVQKAFRQSRSSQIRGTFAAFASDSLFPSSHIAQGVILVELHDPQHPQKVFDIKNIENAISLEHTYETRKFGKQSAGINSTNPESLDFVHFKCVYWNDDSYTWENDGCFFDIHGVTTTCTCSHLTIFALLVSTYTVPNDVSLSTVTFIGCGITVILLFLTIILHLFNRKIRNQVPVKVQLNVYCSLMIGYLAFLVGIEKVDNNLFCSVVASVLHFAFLAGFCWMAVYGHQLYQSFWKKNIHITRDYFVLRSSLLAYGVPIVIVAFTNGISYGYLDLVNQDPSLGPAQNIPQNRDYYQWTYRSSHYCWLHKDILYFSFLLVIGLVLLYNICVAIMVFKRVSTKNTKIRSTVPKLTQLKQIMVVLTLTLSLGITWFIGLFLLLDDNIIYQTILNWIFVVLNAFQGIFIFIVACIKREDMLSCWFGPLAQHLPCVNKKPKPVLKYKHSFTSNSLETSHPYSEKSQNIHTEISAI